MSVTKKFSPVIITLLAFFVAQLVGAVAFFLLAMAVSPELWETFGKFFFEGASGLTPQAAEALGRAADLLALSVMASDILAVVLCRVFMRDIRIGRALDASAVRWRPGLIAVVGGLAGAFGVSVLTESVEVSEALEHTMQTMASSVWGVLAIVVVGPITEELLFREAIAGGMLRRGASTWAAVFVSAVAFGVIHLNLAQGVFALPLGIILGIIYCRTGNVVLTSVLHMLNNGIVIALAYCLGDDYADMNYAGLFGSTTTPYIIMALCLTLCAALLWHFWHAYDKQKKEPTSENVDS